MKRPWQTWLLFGLCLCVALPAMGWLTLKALELDQAEALARAQIELEQDINSALWKMDTEFLTPLMAEEAARPQAVYRSFYDVPAGKDKKSRQVASPLLVQPSEYVLLNFQIAPDGTLSSPQTPAESLNKIALDNGATDLNIKVSNGRAVELNAALDYGKLVDQLPRDTLPPAPNTWDNQISESDKSAEIAPQIDGLGRGNYLGLKNLDEQVAEAQQLQMSAGQSQAPNSSEQKRQVQQEKRSNDDLFGYNTSRSRRGADVRAGQEWATRNSAFQQYAVKELAQQRLSYSIVEQPLSAVSEGVSRPLWVGQRLLLARRAMVDDQLVIQGAWLDWPRIKQALLERISDILPEADLLPVSPEDTPDPGRTLATLPVQLVIPDLTSVGSGPLSPIRVSLLMAWTCLLLATGACALLLLGVVALSERRGAFVSAVTHELRTPLTTFRMYAEMLAEGIVSDEEKRQAYLETLRVEADRLSHLVENVLSYARLERGRRGGRREKIAAGAFLERIQARMEDRAAQAEMTLVVTADQQACNTELNTDPAAAEQILFNLVDNACKYAAAAKDRRVQVEFTRTGSNLEMRVADHGPGISPQAARQLFRPFTKSVHDAANSAPGVGLGLALSRRLARDLGGQLQMEQNGEQHGASFLLTLPLAE